MKKEEKPKFVSINGNYYSVNFVREAKLEFEKMAIVWAAGIENPTSRDRLLFDIIKDIKV